MPDISSLAELKVMSAIEACRTAALGGHVEGCDACGHLRIHLLNRHVEQRIAKGRSAGEVTIAEVLRHYGEAKGGTIADPVELGRRIETLLRFWGRMTLDDIDSATCRRYAEERKKPGAAMRELEDLRAAINLAIDDKICRESVSVTLPEPSGSRQGFLDRRAAARLVWYAYRKREVQTIHRGARQGEKIRTKRRPTKHIARFILFGIYTGTRSSRV